MSNDTNRLCMQCVAPEGGPDSEGHCSTCSNTQCLNNEGLCVEIPTNMCLNGTTGRCEDFGTLADNIGRNQNPTTLNQCGTCDEGYGYDAEDENRVCKKCLAPTPFGPDEVTGRCKNGKQFFN